MEKINEYIYKISWYCGLLLRTDEDANTQMYFKEVEHTYWIWDRCWGDEIVEVQLIKVNINSPEYKSAVENSRVHPSIPLHDGITPTITDLKPHSQF